MDFKEKIESLASVSERLCDLLATENDCLKHRNLGPVRDRVEEKDRLCRAFELLVRGLAKNGEQKDQVDSHTRQLIRETGDRLRVLAEENVSTLKSNIQANEQLMGAIRNAAIECTPKAGNYTQAATVSPGSRMAAKAPTPVTYNEVL